MRTVTSGPSDVTIGGTRTCFTPTVFSFPDTSHVTRFWRSENCCLPCDIFVVERFALVSLIFEAPTANDGEPTIITRILTGNQSLFHIRGTLLSELTLTSDCRNFTQNMCWEPSLCLQFILLYIWTKNMQMSADESFLRRTAINICDAGCLEACLWGRWAGSNQDTSEYLWGLFPSNIWQREITKKIKCFFFFKRKKKTQFCQERINRKCQCWRRSCVC